MIPPAAPLPIISSTSEQIFPTLTKPQIDRIAVHGHTRAMRAGDILVEQGEPSIPFFVVISGEIEAVRPCSVKETLITVVHAGQFTGEVNSLSGRPAVSRLRV